MMERYRRHLITTETKTAGNIQRHWQHQEQKVLENILPKGLQKVLQGGFLFVLATRLA